MSKMKFLDPSEAEKSTKNTSEFFFESPFNLQMKTYIRDDNNDTIEDNVRETNVRTFVEVTDIAKIVRKKSLFGFYR